MGAVEAIVGGIVTLILLLLGAMHVGKQQGKAEAKADANSADAVASAAAAERRVEVMKGASDVQQNVNNMPDDDVDRELLDKWQRPDGH